MINDGSMNEKEAKFRAYITYISHGFTGYIVKAREYARKHGFPESEIDKAFKVGTQF